MTGAPLSPTSPTSPKAGGAAATWPAERTLATEALLEWLAQGGQSKVFDVRGAAEYNQGHVPGAVSLPFPDTSGGGSGSGSGRAARVYQDPTADGCCEVFEPLARQVDEACRSDATEQEAGRLRVVLYCKAGGLRSQSLANFLLHRGRDDVFILEGGYRGFRAWAQAIFERPQKICSVAGATGSGKTEVLSELQKLGKQVIDLEALAHHKGSVFGHLGEAPQPSSEHFLNLLAAAWGSLDPSRFVFLEDEGPRVGKAHVPPALYRRLRAAQLVVHLDVPFSLRAERSLAVYGSADIEELKEAVSCFRSHIGDEDTDALLDRIDAGDLRYVCETALRNYDMSYEHHLYKGRDTDKIVRLEIASLDSSAAARGVAQEADAREEQVEADIPVSPSSSSAPSRRGSQESGGKAEALPVTGAACHCGGVQIKARGPPRMVSVCHCSICRRLSGAPFVVSALFDPNLVDVACSVRVDPPSASVEGGATAGLAELRTSKDVIRRRCPQCSSPVSATIAGRMLAVPLSLFDFGDAPAPEEWKPRHHLHYDRRVLDVSDGLPKYRGKHKGPLWIASEGAGS